ncbi:MAG: hypothetical protein LWW82_10230 [Comamonadaceae bacterium]|nr:hypothetical protein [Comamonadaceae bacterium]
MGFLSLLPAVAVRQLRRLLLRQGRSMGRERMLAVSQKRAFHAVTRAARESVAYQVLLQEQGLDPAHLAPTMPWLALPVLHKANTFARFPLAQLARPVPATVLADVLTSSGRGGRSYGFRLTARAPHEEAWFDIDLGLQDVFGIDERATLLVNCLPMGVVFRSRAVAVANVSVREDMACSILRDVGPSFAQTLVCTDPLFIRRLLDEGEAAGVDWRALKTSVIVGEEVLVEAQRDYIAARMGIDVDRDAERLVGSSFGVGELGLNLLFETRSTIQMRRAMRHQPAVVQALCGMSVVDALPSVFCYNPLRSHIEVLQPDAYGFGELCITMLDTGAVIPLPRHATGDWGRLVSAEEASRAAALAGVQPPWLPVAVVQGRIKDRRPGWPSVEALKELLYLDHAVADQLSGAFRWAQDPQGQAQWTLQCHPGAEPTLWLLSRIQDLCTRHGWPQVSVELLAAADFPWRPMLDFERKFSYVE